MKSIIKLVIVVIMCFAFIWISLLFSIEKTPLVYEGFDKLKELIDSSEFDEIDYITVNSKYDILDIYNGILTNSFFDSQTNLDESDGDSYDKEQIEDTIKEIMNNIDEADWTFEDFGSNKLSYSQFVDFGEYIVVKYSFHDIDKAGLKKFYNFAFFLEADSFNENEYHAFIFWTCLKYLDSADICVRLPIKEYYYYEIRR